MQNIYIPLIGVFLITIMILPSATFAQNTNSTNSTSPGTISTPSGGWITPPQTHDENGNNLTIHFAPGIPRYGKVSTGPAPIMHMILQTDKQVYTSGNVTVSGQEDEYLLQNYANNLTLSIDDSNTGEKWCCYNFKSNSNGFFSFSFKLPPVFQNSDNYNARLSSGNSTDQYSVGFLYYFNSNNAKTTTIKSTIESPLKQTQAGISVENIVCNEGLKLIIKSENGSPVCVKPDTAQILIERSWARVLQ